jgi:hypothetical protein
VRTTAAAVQSVLMDDYGPRVDGSLPDLQPYISSATVVVDRVAFMAAARGLPLLDSELELVERWLSAHMYCQSDRQVQSRSQGGVSGSFGGQLTDGFQSTTYGQTACRIDYSGSLQALDRRQRGRVAWLGTPQ